MFSNSQDDPPTLKPTLEEISFELRHLKRTGQVSLDCELELIDYMILEAYVTEPEPGRLEITSRGEAVLSVFRRESDGHPVLN